MSSNICIIQKMLISRSSKQKYDFKQIQIGTRRISLVGVILTLGPYYYIQGHLQCQKVKLKVLNVTQYYYIFFT